MGALRLPPLTSPLLGCLLFVEEFASWPFLKRHALSGAPLRMTMSNSGQKILVAKSLFTLAIQRM
jgi:hypothetical protein